MDLVRCVRERRSVRKYSDKELMDSTIAEIVENARFAPTWKNSQTTRYNIVSDELKSKLLAEGFQELPYNIKIIERCKKLVIVSLVKGVSGYNSDGSFTTSLKDNWEAFDSGIATQTFCLCAHELGVGTVILGLFDPELIHKLAGIPDSERVIALIAMGYPETYNKPAPPRKEVGELLRTL